MRNIIVKSLSLSLLQEKGLPHFHIFDIRSTQAFLSAHLQDSFHAKDEEEIIESLEYLAGGGRIIRKISTRYKITAQCAIAKASPHRLL